MDKTLEQIMAETLDKSSHITINSPKFRIHVGLRRMHTHQHFAEFKERWGGYHTQSRHDGAWWYSVEGRKAFQLLQDVYPYLEKKKVHAELCFKLQESIDRFIASGQRGLALPREEYLIRTELVDAIKKMNSAEFRLKDDEELQ